MKKLRGILLFAFIVAGIINFLGVAYFKSSNISAFENYVEFFSENEAIFKELENYPDVKDNVLYITGTYRAFKEKGIDNSDDMRAYHIKNVRKGAPVISNYYQLYKMGKVYDEQIKIGKLLIDEVKK